MFPNPKDLVGLTYRDAWLASGGALRQKTKAGLENILENLGVDENEIVSDADEAWWVFAMAGTYSPNAAHVGIASDVCGDGRVQIPFGVYQEREGKPGLLKRLQQNHPYIYKGLVAATVIGTMGLAAVGGFGAVKTVNAQAEEQGANVVKLIEDPENKIHSPQVWGNWVSWINYRDVYLMNLSTLQPTKVGVIDPSAAQDYATQVALRDGWLAPIIKNGVYGAYNVINGSFVDLQIQGGVQAAAISGTDLAVSEYITSLVYGDHYQIILYNMTTKARKSLSGSGLRGDDSYPSIAGKYVAYAVNRDAAVNLYDLEKKFLKTVSPNYEFSIYAGYNPPEYYGPAVAEDGTVLWWYKDNDNNDDSKGFDQGIWLYSNGTAKRISSGMSSHKTVRYNTYGVFLRPQEDVASFALKDSELTADLFYNDALDVDYHGDYVVIKSNGKLQILRAGGQPPTPPPKPCKLDSSGEGINFLNNTYTIVLSKTNQCGNFSAQLEIIGINTTSRLEQALYSGYFIFDSSYEVFNSLPLKFNEQGKVKMMLKLIVVPNNPVVPAYNHTSGPWTFNTGPPASQSQSMPQQQAVINQAPTLKFDKREKYFPADPYGDKDKDVNNNPLNYPDGFPQRPVIFYSIQDKEDKTYVEYWTHYVLNKWRGADKHGLDNELLAKEIDKTGKVTRTSMSMHVWNNVYAGNISTAYVENGSHGMSKDGKSFFLEDFSTAGLTLTPNDYELRPIENLEPYKEQDFPGERGKFPTGQERYKNPEKAFETASWPKALQFSIMDSPNLELILKNQSVAAFQDGEIVYAVNNIGPEFLSSVEFKTTGNKTEKYKAQVKIEYPNRTENAQLSLSIKPGESHHFYVGTEHLYVDKDGDGLFDADAPYAVERTRQATGFGPKEKILAAGAAVGGAIAGIFGFRRWRKGKG